MAISHDEIYKKVQGVLMDALGVDEDEVTPKATLKDDLGAESIDYLDIVFRLEKAFTTDPAKPSRSAKTNCFPKICRRCRAIRASSTMAKSPPMASPNSSDACHMRTDRL